MDYEVGDRVFLTYMREPGTVLKVITFANGLYGFIVAVDDRDVELFRLDEVEDFDPEKWLQ